MLILLTILSGIVALIFFGVLAVYLFLIGNVLDEIGGAPHSYLAKLRLGLRAIETETGHLPVQATKLNQNLAAIGEGLETVDGHLSKTIEAVLRQERG